MDTSRDVEKIEAWLRENGGEMKYGKNPLPGDRRWELRAAWVGGYSPPPDEVAGKPFMLLNSCLQEDVGFLKPDDWPEAVELSLVPHDFLVGIGFDHLRNAASLLVRPERCAAVEVLTTELLQNWVAVLQFPKPRDKPWNLKLMLMLFCDDADFFVGFIPKDQDRCVEKFKAVIEAADEKDALDGDGKRSSLYQPLASSLALHEDRKKCELTGDFFWRGQLVWIEKNACPNGCQTQWTLDAGFSFSGGNTMSIEAKDWPYVIEVVFLTSGFFQGWANPLLHKGHVDVHLDVKRTAFQELLRKLGDRKLCVGRFMTEAGETKLILIGCDQKTADLRGFVPKNHEQFRSILLKNGDEFMTKHYGRPLFPMEGGDDKEKKTMDDAGPEQLT